MCDPEEMPGYDATLPTPDYDAAERSGVVTDHVRRCGQADDALYVEIGDSRTAEEVG